LHVDPTILSTNNLIERSIMKNLFAMNIFAVMLLSGWPFACQGAQATAADHTDQLESLGELFPDGLRDAEGNKVDVDALKGKATAIYFSASWCGPCKVFSPQLAKFRENYKDQIAVVFVSWDKSAEAQKSYMKKAAMSDYTVELNSAPAKALAAKYQVRGIPSLVMLKSNGDFLTTDGRAIVSGGYDGSKLADPGITVKVETETYTCDRCTKLHKRQVIKGLDLLADGE
jgi:thiol-disulfide isomerase/thioredoxin